MKPLSFLPIVAVMFFKTCHAQTEERYSGVFVNTEVGLSVSVLKKGEQYTGFFEYQQKRYPFKGVKTLGIMDAEYDYNNQKIPFTLSYLFGSYYVSSEGMNIVMERKSKLAIDNPPKQPAPNTGQVNVKVVPATGKRISDAYSGYSFQLPLGWSYRQNNGAFLLIKKGEEVELSVGPHNYKSREDVLNQLQDVRDDNADTYMQASIKQNSSNLMLVKMEGRLNGNDMIIETALNFSPYSGGVSISAAAGTNNYSSRYTEILRSIAATIQFSRPVISPAVKEWTALLSGKQLIYLNTAGGGSQKIVINLYRDGSFSHSNNSSYLSGGSSTLSYAGGSSDQGSWKILNRGSQVVLILNANDGSAREYVITGRQARGEINLDERRYFLKTLD